MCAPCKVVINEESASSAERMHTIACILQTDFPDLSQETDDRLYEIAKREVEFIEARRAAGVDMARAVGAGDRWVKLMERL